MLKKSYQVLDLFVTNPSITYLFGDVKGHIGSKSESYTYNSLKSFVKEGILTKDKRGGVAFYKIADSPKAISFLSMAAEYKAWNRKGIPINNIIEVIKKAKINFLTLVITGSYVKRKQTAKSDLDLVLIVPNDVKKVTARLKQFCELSIPEIHLYVFTDDEFKLMLLDEKHNYGKEIVKNSLIFYGAEAYYKIMFEAMKNGFTY
ncbi:MAG TPA: nucleotidyltransferase domain-containing protein [Candidatus Nanoarchaeia archaeon]|nr:nucleotidyltransferase domain-containing protein [Candidatus Nanoarchaeia archaeon]